MKVYHGSEMIIKHPNTLHSHRALDFGSGFYVTTVREQAERWALRKADLSGNKAWLNTYEMSAETDSLIVKDFGDDLSEWIDFVLQCRAGNDAFRQYDLIIGKVADDRVYRVVDLYTAGIWDKERALKEIRTYPTYDQIAFITDRAIEKLLTFVCSEEVAP